jgi:hypothetical protein
VKGGGVGRLLSCVAGCFYDIGGTDNGDNLINYGAIEGAKESGLLTVGLEVIGSFLLGTVVGALDLLGEEVCLAKGKSIGTTSIDGIPAGVGLKERTAVGTAVVNAAVGVKVRSPPVAAGVGGEVTMVAAGVGGEVTMVAAGVGGEVTMVAAGVGGEVTMVAAGVGGEVTMVVAGVGGEVTMVAAGVGGEVVGVVVGPLIGFTS